MSSLNEDALDVLSKDGREGGGLLECEWEVNKMPSVRHGAGGNGKGLARERGRD